MSEILENIYAEDLSRNTYIQADMATFISTTCLNDLLINSDSMSAFCDLNYFKLL